jgi:hypothetical protein
MTRYTGAQIRDACAKAGFSTTPSVDVDGVKYSPADVMAAIALGESGGDDQAVNPSSGAAGVFQILPAVWGKYISLQGMHDLNTAASFCYTTISHQGTTFSPWVVYNEGTYKHFLPLPGAAGASPPAPSAANPPQGVSGGSAVAGSVLGIVRRPPRNGKTRGLIFLVALTGMFLVVVGVSAWTKEPLETVVKAAV